MNGPRPLIVGAAPAPGCEQAYRRIIGEASYVIAADGGLGLCLAVGRMPDVVVGDLDSVDPSSLSLAVAAGVQIVRYPAEKDESDLDLASAFARDSDARSVRFTAMTSGRLDHTLAALGTLMRSTDLSGLLEEPGYTGFALRAPGRSSHFTMCRAGQLVSVFALVPETHISLSGVRYPLDSSELPVLSSLGLSNVALGGEVGVTVHSGAVVVIIFA